MTLFKICGLREEAHVLAAVEAGASFLGFNFVPGVRRQLTEEKAQEIIQEYRRHAVDAGPKLVGLFANQPIEDVNRIIQHCGLDMAQLCGDEPPDYWNQVEAQVIRQVKVRDDGPRDDAVNKVLRRVQKVVECDCIPLLDKHEQGALGGTGRSFDWTIARDVARRFEILLAGGLNPQNVGQAISMARPWGVDVSSGVESDGAKDENKIRAFAEAVNDSSNNAQESDG